MVRSREYAPLAGSLATIAIAALGGPLPAVATAGLSEFVTFARGRYERNALTRDLQREVEVAILVWVEGGAEFKEVGVGKLGLTQAAWVIARFGVSDRRSADLGYSAGPAAREVISAAKRDDQYWGTEDHYLVAEAAIRCTYEGLYRQLRSEERVLIPAIQSLRGDISAHAQRLADQLRDQGEHLDGRFDTLEEQNAQLNGLLSDLVAVEIGSRLAALSDQVEGLASRVPAGVSGSYGATLRSMVRAVEVRLPDGLTGRDRELAEFAEFATGSVGYRWLVGGAFTGKSAVMLHAVTVACPRSVDVVSYFLRRVASDADSDRFLAAVVPQLAELCQVGWPSADEHTFRALWEQAAARADEMGRHLLLVVDGLDEDLRPAGRPSVAALLPDFVAGTAAGAECAHVHVTSRPRPELPADLTAIPGHPLAAEVPVDLEGFPGWEELRDLGLAEIDTLVRSVDDLPADLLGLLAATAGPVSVSDLATLNASPARASHRDHRAVREFLEQARSVDQVGSGDAPRYQFAHSTLLEHAQQHLDLSDPDFRDRIHAWAQTWEQAGWPDPGPSGDGTPPYLLDTYPATLGDNPARREALVGDIKWVDAALRGVGVDWVLSALREAAAAGGSGRVEAMYAVVAAQQANLRPPLPVSQPGHAARQLALQAMVYDDLGITTAALSRLETQHAPGPIPVWTTRRSRPPLLEVGGHDGGVSAVAVLPDGRVVTGGGDGRVRLWDPQQPGRPTELGGHDGAVRGAAVLPDGRVVTGGVDRRVRLWDPQQPGLATELGGHDDGVSAVAGLPDGRVVTGGVDRRVRLWDPQQPGRPTELGGHDGAVRGAAVLPDGRVVTGGVRPASAAVGPNPAWPAHRVG